jgi:hypothetical protein
MFLFAQSARNLFSDGENSGPNPSLHTELLRSQTRNQASNDQKKQG